MWLLSGFCLDTLSTASLFNAPVDQLLSSPHSINCSHLCGNQILEGHCPAEFSSNPDHTHKKPTNQCFQDYQKAASTYVSSQLYLNSVEQWPSRTTFACPCLSLAISSQALPCLVSVCVFLVTCKAWNVFVGGNISTQN